MKKIFNSLFIVIILLFVVGCGSTTPTDDKEYVTITFETGGETEISSLKIEKGTIPGEPAEPKRNGYEFDGWLLFGQPYSFSSPVASDLVLTAKWNDLSDILNSEYRDIVIYSLNDFHGALNQDEGEFGMSRIAAFLKKEQAKEYQTTIILSAGDMFQGSALSNYKYGLDVINIMNYINFDAMTLGNHEFDWGLDKMGLYKDDDKTNGEADFPFLGCNIFEKETNELVDFVDPYVIFERDDYKFAVVGYMGYGLEDSIATSMIKDYYFDDPVKCVSDAVYEIRSNDLADFVIAVGHDGSDSVNQQLANLTGDYQVDAIFNGHTHNSYTKVLTSIDARRIPVVQAGTAGELLGKIVLSVHKENQSIDSVLSENVSMATGKLDPFVEEYLAQANEEVAPFFKRVIGQAGRDLNSKYTITDWAVETIKNSTGADIAFTNLGGLRASAFPIKEGADITVEKLYEIMPFDNAIKLVTMKGYDIQLMFNVGDFIHTDLEIDPDKEYRVAAIDYIFDNDSYLFNKGTDIEVTGLLFRDVMIEAIEKNTEKGLKWME